MTARTIITRERRTEATDRLQLQLSRIAVDVQVIAGKLAHQRQPRAAQAINEAADALAACVFQMGPVRTLDAGTFALNFDHLWRGLGYSATKEEQADADEAAAEQEGTS